LARYAVRATTVVDEHLAVAELARKKRRCLLVEVSRATDDNVRRYCEFHEAFMSSVADDGRLMLVYDLRGAVADDWSTTLLPFIRLHSLLRERYKSTLRCTYILINSTALQMLINGLLSTVYTPTRPVHIVTDPAEIE
jgi:hypothetical protein